MKKILPIVIISSLLFLPAFATVEAKSIAKSRPTAICKDGTYSYSANRQGTCSHHKGVRAWLK